MKATYHDAIAVVKTLRTLGFDSYLAGGCVRDLLLGLEPNDYDVTTAATPADIQSAFPRTVPVGESFGVVKVVTDGRELDVATFRTDGKYSDNRRPDEVTYSKSAAEDVKRRDFTINALLMTETGEVIDYVGGREDLQNRILRTVGDPSDRFSEDSLRMLRAIRFANRFDLRIDPATWSAIESLALTISNVSTERVTDELTKTFAHGNCDTSFWMMLKSGLWNSWFEVSNNYGDLYQSMKALSKVNPGSPFVLPLAVIVAPMYRSGREDVLAALVLTNDQKKAIKSILDKYADVTQFITKSRHGKRRVMNLPDIDLIMDFIRCSSFGKICSYNLTDENGLGALLSEMREIKEEGFPEPLINGHDLEGWGYIAGPVFSKMLTDVQNGQLDDVILTKDQAKTYIEEHFPAAPRRMEDGTITDGMGPFRLIATCGAGHSMSFEVSYNEQGKPLWNTVKNKINCRVIDCYVECRECYRRRSKTAFARMVV